LEFLEVKATSGAVLRVEFIRLADRYQHVISLDDYGGSAGQRMIEVLRSAEGDAGDAWPSSPPLQSLSIETLNDGRRVALLVGMAGRGHWSASVETDEARTALMFDVACRSAVRPEQLLSCYALGLGVERVRVVAENAPPVPARVAREGEWLAVTCPMPAQAVGPTWRWRYRVELLPAAR
jgi:hypothetical protein